MISQIFILSSKGDTIINRDFRSDLIKNTPELFYRKVKLDKGDTQPIFNIQGINFGYLKKSSLYVVATTRFNVSPAYFLQLLNRILTIIKDFCGNITQEIIRKNFVLIYQILDQFIDFGHSQLTNTSQIKPLIVSQAIQQKQSILSNAKKFGFLAPQTRTSIVFSLINTKNLIQFHVYQKINMIFNSSGYAINSSIDGCIQIKNNLKDYISLKAFFNKDLVMADSDKLGSVILSDAYFHECVDYNQFIVNKSLIITPPEGEFIFMNYRVNTDFNAPFKVFAFFEPINYYKTQLILKLKATYPKQIKASFVSVKFAVPKKVSGISSQIIKNEGNQNTIYNQQNNTVQWQIKNMPGQAEYTLSTKFVLLQSEASPQKQTGPININFQIPHFTISNLQIRIAQVLKGDQSSKRWIKYTTKSGSYVCRI